MEFPYRCIVGIRFDVDRGPQRLVACVAGLDPEERLKVEFALDVDPERVESDTCDGRVRGVADRKARAECSDEVLNGVRRLVRPTEYLGFVRGERLEVPDGGGGVEPAVPLDGSVSCRFGMLGFGRYGLYENADGSDVDVVELCCCCCHVSPFQCDRKNQSGLKRNAGWTSRVVAIPKGVVQTRPGEPPES